MGRPPGGLPLWGLIQWRLVKGASSLPTPTLPLFQLLSIGPQNRMRGVPGHSEWIQWMFEYNVFLRMEMMHGDCTTLFSNPGLCAGCSFFLEHACACFHLGAPRPGLIHTALSRGESPPS